MSPPVGDKKKFNSKFLLLARLRLGPVSDLMGMGDSIIHIKIAKLLSLTIIRFVGVMLTLKHVSHVVFTMRRCSSLLSRSHICTSRYLWVQRRNILLLKTSQRHAQPIYGSRRPNIGFSTEAIPRWSVSRTGKCEKNQCNRLIHLQSLAWLPAGNATSAVSNWLLNVVRALKSVKGDFLYLQDFFSDFFWFFLIFSRSFLIFNSIISFLVVCMSP